MYTCIQCTLYIVYPYLEYSYKFGIPNSITIVICYYSIGVPNVTLNSIFRKPGIAPVYIIYARVYIIR